MHCEQDDPERKKPTAHCLQIIDELQEKQLVGQAVHVLLAIK